MEDKKLKVVWICQISNSEIRRNLKFNDYTLINIINKIRKKNNIADYGVWNTNAIKEFKKFDDIELHIIAAHTNISGIQEFISDNVYYHIFGTDDNSIVNIFKRKILKQQHRDNRKNIKTICSIVHKINPDIIHLIGAENPQYSESVLHMPKDRPLIVALQTLMIDPDFFANYPISKEEYEYRSNIERKVLLRADYLSFRAKRFKEVLEQEFGSNLNILDMPLVVGEEIRIENCKKEYDFVYFAADISKAVDYAIEAFALAKTKYPNITLHVVGGYNDRYMQQIQLRIQELKLSSSIDFTGKLPTHDDVIKEIRKARFALLPLKIDLISGTIREAMANGLPVITTITPSTPKLNEARQSILLSEKGDHKAMAEDMISLLNSKELAESIKANAFLTIKEKFDNETFANIWRTQYYNVIKEWKETRELQ